MTDSTGDDRPLALGDLAQTESPELVRAALGRFRRRLLVRSLVVLLAIGAAVVLYPRYFEKPKELQQEILEARGIDLLREVAGGFVDATVVRAARLSKVEFVGRGERYGLLVYFNAHFTQPDEKVVPLLQPTRRNGVLDVVASAAQNEVWISVQAGTRVLDLPFAGLVQTPDGARFVHPSLGTVHLDMQALHIPDWIWR